MNKVKIDNPEAVVSSDLLLNKKYLLVQKGKKNYYLIRVS
jgi:tyrosyl-tRNA synthetase